MTLFPADQAFIDALSQLLPPGILTSAEPRHLEEPRGRWHGVSTRIAMPRDVHQVACIIQHCAASRVPVVPLGGGTGLVGGQIAPSGPAPLLLSLERMSRINTDHVGENILIAEAGAILADIQSAASNAGRSFALSLASEGSARIGGLLATNAGGVNVLRYGNARDQVLGLQAVLPDGQIWNGLKRLRKDNTGYDLRNLLIGSEGTLGVITAASLKLRPRPASVGTALLAVTDPQAALDLLSLAGEHLGDGISAFELMHRMGFDFVAKALPDLRQPWPTPPDWSVLIEVEGFGDMQPTLALEQIAAKAAERGLITDGLIAQNLTQARAFWSLREHIPVGNMAIGAIASHDISVPLGAIPEFITQAGQALAQLGTYRVNCFGHVGDGNLHYNVFPPEGRARNTYDDQRATITRTIHDLVASFDGSFSAEHGIGRLKVGDLERYGDPVKLSAMRAIKQALDPAGICNPGAVLR